MTQKMLYLAKAPGPHPVSFCACSPDEALIAAPGQMDCPWCGCGWLFSCTLCRKAFTFAVAVETPFSLRELARGDVQRFGAQPSIPIIDGWVRSMGVLLDGLVCGERYVYLDGVVHRANPSAGVRFTGQYGAHSLTVLPQCAPGATGESLSEVLDRDYWQAAQRSTSASPKNP